MYLEFETITVSQADAIATKYIEFYYESIIQTLERRI